MDLRSYFGVVAIIAIVVGNFWLGSTGGHQPRRASALFNGSEVRHDVRPLRRISYSQLMSPGRSAVELDEPFIISDLLSDVPASVASAWDPESLIAGTSPVSSASTDASVEFYPDNMDAYHLLRKAVRLPLGQAVAALSGRPWNGVPAHVAWQSEDRAQMPRRYAHWNINRTHWDALFAAVLPGVLERLPASLAYTEEWLREVLSAPVDSNDTGVNAGSIGNHADDPAVPIDPAADWLAVTHWRMVLLGSHGAGMFNHRDALAAGSWQLQLTGAKRWHLCAPNQSPAVAAEEPLTGTLSHHVGLDMLRPGNSGGQAGTYTLYPRALGASCLLDVVLAGEAIVYPAGWWHQTENIAPDMPVEGDDGVAHWHADAAGFSTSATGSAEDDEFAQARAPVQPAPAPVGIAVAITESVVTRSAWRDLAATMRANCGKVHRPGLTPSPQLCARLPALIADWEAHFERAQDGVTDSSARAP